jgi:hypothetical protein
VSQVTTTLASEEEHARLEASALKIQAAFRGYRTRKSFARPPLPVGKPGNTLQLASGNAPAQAEAAAAVRIQAMFRGHRARKLSRALRASQGEQQPPLAPSAADTGAPEMLPAIPGPGADGSEAAFEEMLQDVFARADLNGDG